MLAQAPVFARSCCLSRSAVSPLCFFLRWETETKKILLLTLLLPLAGCQTAAERQASQLASAQQQCTTFGFRKGTPEYANCSQSMFVANRQQEAADNERRAEALSAAGRSLQAASAPPVTVAPTTTNCQNLAGMVQCRTF